MSHTTAELEKDIIAIEQSLATVSEIRTSLRYFTRLIQEDRKGPHFVQNFSHRLNAVKRELNKLSTESDRLRGALDHAQQLSGKDAFVWPMIKAAAGKKAAEEQSVQETGDMQKEVGMAIKEKADHVLGQLSLVVLERTQRSSTQYITSCIQHWLVNEKPAHIAVTVDILQEEVETLMGSTCCIKVSVQRVLVATLALGYEKDSNTLFLHQHDICGPREEKLAWQLSEHLVFQKINTIANDAFGDMTVLSTKEAVSSILHWLASYYHLFTEPCYRCHKQLQFDSPHYKHLPAVSVTVNNEPPVIDLVS